MSPLTPSVLPRLAACLISASSFACVLQAPDADDDGASTGAADGGSTGAMSTSANTTQGSTDTPDPDDSGGAQTQTSGDTDEPDPDTGDPVPTDCSTATLLLGNPFYDGELGLSNPAGHGRLEDPPLRSRHLGVVGGRLAVETQTEVWVLEDDLLHRVAGNEVSEADRYRPIGACDEVRLLLGEGIAALPDGRMVVADGRGNGVVELSDPLSDSCTAAPIAGNMETTLAVDIDEVGAPGDLDGPGADARFWGVSRPVADDVGNVYVIDRGNGKIKQIADDADRTVTTVFEYGGIGNALSMTFLDGVLYVGGTIGVDDALWGVDVARGSVETLYVGTGLFAEIPADEPALMISLANDGVDLLVGSHEGYVLRLSTAAFPLGAIAGYGPIVDYPQDLDVSGSIPTSELPIDSYSGSEGSIARLGDDILVSNLGGGTGYHVWSIHCGR